MPPLPLPHSSNHRTNAVLCVAAHHAGLGHKEVRFLFPVLPLWNLAAGIAAARLWAARRRSLAARAAALALVAALAAGLALTVVTAAASARNYPGGAALRALHVLGAADAAAAAAAGRALRVHIGVLPAMTGVSRFGEAGAPWRYSKEEGLTTAQLAARKFDFLVTDAPSVPGYAQAAAVHGFQGLHLEARSPGGVLRALLQRRQPLRILTAPRVYIQRRLSEGAAALADGGGS